MLTQKPPTTSRTSQQTAKKGARPQDDTLAWFEGRWTPLADAKVSIMTHSFLYGTAVFEGIRAYWNADDEQLYLLKAREHFERIVDSSKILMMEPGYGVDEMVAMTIELLRRNGYREDCYVRATVYKSDEAIGVRLHDLEARLNLISIPFGDYIATDRPISCGTVSWRRTGDLSIPSRGKVVGSYVNPAFSKTEAMLNGYEEAIVLTNEGEVSEGSAENLFMVRKGRLVTPGVHSDILEGITRAGIIELARRELGLECEVRGIDRSELYVADEVFLCGTGAQVSPVASVDHRMVGNGGIGPVTAAIMAVYFDAVRGRSEAYRHWVTPVY
jgi:branched-chain amino acid aminotransferase